MILICNRFKRKSGTRHVIGEEVLGYTSYSPLQIGEQPPTARQHQRFFTIGPLREDCISIEESISDKMYLIFILLLKHLFVSEWVCVFGCSLTPLKRQAGIWRYDSPWDWEGFRLKNICICQNVGWKIVCILAPHSTRELSILFSPVWIFSVFGRLVGGGEIDKW